jgi:hypothetical protein
MTFNLQYDRLLTISLQPVRETPALVPAESTGEGDMEKVVDGGESAKRGASIARLLWR